MKKQIVFVTSNKGKLQTAQTYFDKDVEIVYYNFDIKEPEVNDIDYIAEYKVKEAYEKVKKACISLDAGFYIPNFPNNPNFPGAFPRRELLEKLGLNGLLNKMKNVINRECYFKECLAYYDGKVLKKFYGLSSGRLSTEIKGNDSDKKWSNLWYVFIPNNNTKTMAEMTDDERRNRNDGYINPFIEFSEWFKNKEDYND